jgi:hypothetical protein
MEFYMDSDNPSGLVTNNDPVHRIMIKKEKEFLPGK